MHHGDKYRKKTVKNVAVSFYLERYMDNPIESTSKIDLNPGESKTVDLFTLFNENLMEITKGTKTSSRTTAGYPGNKDAYTTDGTDIPEFYNRNAIM